MKHSWERGEVDVRAPYVPAWKARQHTRSAATAQRRPPSCMAATPADALLDSTTDRRHHGETALTGRHELLDHRRPTGHKSNCVERDCNPFGLPGAGRAVSGEAARQVLSNSRRSSHTKHAFDISLCLASAAYRTDEHGDGEATNMKVSPR